MKRYIYILAVLALILVSSCSDDHDNVRPGLYLEKTVIESFPGDTILINGQASNYVGIQSIRLLCDAWNVDQVHDFGGEKPVVMDFNYKVPVPDDADFDQALVVEVTDINGLESEKIIQMLFAPDTEAPKITGLQSYISVEYNKTESNGVLNLDFQCSDDRKIGSLDIQIPNINYHDTIQGTGRTMHVDKDIDFTEMGSYDMTVTLTDASGNTTQTNSTITVLPHEDEYQIEDYKQMYVVTLLNEDPDDYIDGYYHYMERIDEYKYQCTIHASSTEQGFLFVPTKSMTGYVYGSSPYANFKILNNRNYVVPTHMEQPGYYTLTLDIQNHSFTVEPLDLTGVYNKSSLLASGDGFRTFDNWGSMQKTADYEYTVYADQDGSAKPEWGRYYYFVGVTDDGGWDWTRIFRADAEGHKWYEVDGGNGALIYESDYDGRVKITFDTAMPFGTIKKVK